MAAIDSEGRELRVGDVVHLVDVPSAGFTALDAAARCALSGPLKIRAIRDEDGGVEALLDFGAAATWCAGRFKRVPTHNDASVTLQQLIHEVERTNLDLVSALHELRLATEAARTYEDAGMCWRQEAEGRVARHQRTVSRVMAAQARAALAWLETHATTEAGK